MKNLYIKKPYGFDRHSSFMIVDFQLKIIYREMNTAYWMRDYFINEFLHRGGLIKEYEKYI